MAEIGHAEEEDEEEEKKKKKRKTKEKIPVMNGGCSWFNESPRWSSTGNKESVRGKRSRKPEVAREEGGRGKKEKEKESPFIQQPKIISPQILKTYKYYSINATEGLYGQKKKKKKKWTIKFGNLFQEKK